GSQIQTGPGLDSWRSTIDGDGQAQAVQRVKQTDGTFITYHYSVANNLGAVTREKFDANGTLVETTEPALTGLDAKDKPGEFVHSPFVVNNVDPVVNNADPTRPVRLLLGYINLYQSVDYGAKVQPINDTDVNTKAPALSALAFGGRNPD